MTFDVSASKAANRTPLTVSAPPAISRGSRGPRLPTSRPDSGAHRKVGTAIGNIGEARTLGYASHGALGMITLFMRGMLCNWMVSTGVVGAMVSTSVPGKVIAMWMPIMLFFYMVFEHSIVNMFLFPSGLMLHAKFSIMDYLIWNEIPTVLGNLVGGLAFTGMTLYATHVMTKPKRQVDKAAKPRVAA